MNLVEIRGLSKKFGNNVVLDNVDLDIKKGEVVAIIGPSGTGKSTLLRCLNLLEKPEAGSVKFNDKTFNLTTKNKKEKLELRQHTEMVFQQFNLFKNKDALSNVMEGLTVVKKIPKEEARKKALEEIEKVGMSDRLYHYPKHLSGGQQQRVAIARALENGKIVADGTPKEIFENPTNERLKTFLSNINMLESADNYII